MTYKYKRKLVKIPGLIFLKKKLQQVSIPGWNGLSLFDLAILYLEGIVKGAFSTRASAISYSLFLSIFPFLLFLLNLIPFIPIDNFQEEFILFIGNLLPPNTSLFFDSIITDIVNNKRGGLLSSTFLLSMFLMTNGINAVFSGFNNSYHTSMSRSFLRQYSVAFGVAIMVALFLIFMVCITLYYTYLVNTYTVFLIGDTLFWLKYGQILLFVSMIFLIISTLFYFGTKAGKAISFFSPGAIFTTLLILSTTYGFSFYITNFSNYNEVYGSIGALLILMLYLWLNCNLVLLGYELNATIIKLKTRNLKY